MGNCGLPIGGNLRGSDLYETCDGLGLVEAVLARPASLSERLALSAIAFLIVFFFFFFPSQRLRRGCWRERV